MKLEDLLAEVSQRREVVRLEQEYVLEQKRAIEVERIEKLQKFFQAHLQNTFGDILSALNVDIGSSVQHLDNSFQCCFEIEHVTISILQLDSKIEEWQKAQPWFGISATASNNYFSRLQIADSETIWLPLEEACTYLTDAIFDIHQEYDRLLPVFEYRRAIEEAQEKSDKEIAALNTRLKEWKWPEGRLVRLYKIIWAKHGFLDSQGKAHFDYDFGWSLTGLPRSLANGYYDLLPQKDQPTREVKPGYPVTVLRYYFSEAELPKELTEKPVQQLETVKVYDCVCEAYTRLLPQFLPELPPADIADSFDFITDVEIFRLDTSPKPIFEIRQALSKPDTEDSELF